LISAIVYIEYKEPFEACEPGDVYFYLPPLPSPGFALLLFALAKRSKV